MEILEDKPIPRRRYQQLFWAIITFFILVTFFNIGRFGGFLLGFGFLTTIILAIRTFPLSPSIKLIFRLLTIFAFTLGVMELLMKDGRIEQTLDILSSLVYVFFLILSMFFLNHKILLVKTVNEDILLGGVSIYLLFGILFYIIYRIIYLFNENAFSQLIDVPHYRLFYFSFTTLTTLGYGDITPVSRLAMGFTNIEAIIGQLYPAVFLARLVSLYTTSEFE